jgi:hypothetical protein
LNTLDLNAHHSIHGSREREKQTCAMLLLCRCVSYQASPAQDHGNLIRFDNRDAGQQVQQGHRDDPPVHPLPRAVDHACERRYQTPDFGGWPLSSHFLFSRRENGSESVRRTNDVPAVTNLSKDSKDRVNL